MRSAANVAKKVRAMRGGPIPASAVREAGLELKKKTLEDIETATAMKWGARALAAWDLALEAEKAGLEELRFAEALRAATFKGEAIEHGAFGKPKTLDALRKQLQDIPY